MQILTAINSPVFHKLASESLVLDQVYHLKQGIFSSSFFHSADKEKLIAWMKESHPKIYCEGFYLFWMEVEPDDLLGILNNRGSYFGKVVRVERVDLELHFQPYQPSGI